MTVSTEQERATREDFEHWATSTNQGYDLTRNQSGRMQTYEYAWRGFFHGWQAARSAQVVEPTEFDTSTSTGARNAVAWYFANVLHRHDFAKYITNTLAADFACALAPALRAQPVAVPQGWKLVPVELLDRATESLGSFVSDHGWGQADMDTFDDLSALAAHGIK